VTAASGVRYLYLLILPDLFASSFVPSLSKYSPHSADSGQASIVRQAHDQGERYSCLIRAGSIREALNKSFDGLRTNGKLLISFVVGPSTSLRRALSNHERNQLVQSFLRWRMENSGNHSLNYSAGAVVTVIQQITGIRKPLPASIGVPHQYPSPLTRDVTIIKHSQLLTLHF